MQTTAASRERVLKNDWKPRNCVWELTLACNLRCAHCGSIAGKVRQNELSTEECLRIVQQLADLGCELVTLSGGEPTLRKDWPVIARSIADRGIYVNMVTNGVYRSDEHAKEIAETAVKAGLCNVAVSIDGPKEIHEQIRGAGTYAKSIRSIRHFVRAGLKVAVLTTISQLNMGRLNDVRQLAIEAGATLWRLQLAKPMGTMDDHRSLVIRPTQLLELLPLLVRMKKAGGIQLFVGDSIGYYGRYDRILRGRGWRGRRECWKGCQAGMQAIGIEANGDIKGCLSLQAKWNGKDPFVEGNLREHSLDELWDRPEMFAYNREFQLDSLSGFCGRCRYGSLCRGGARCVSAATVQRLTEDPYCYQAVLGERKDLDKISRRKTAMAAAIALALTVGTASCANDGTAKDTVTLLDQSDTSIAPEYGVFPDLQQDLAEDISIAPEYGVFPDLQQDLAEDISIAPEYGVFPDLQPADADMSVAVEYGVFPDTQSPDTKSDVDCEAVCCDCDYGTPPPPECCP